MFRAALISRTAKCWLNGDMTIDEIRLQNLMILLRECAGGVQAQLAKDVGSPASYINQIIKGTKTPSGATRGVGDDLAQRLEKAYGKPRGWMDTVHHNTLTAREERQEYATPEKSVMEMQQELNDICLEYGLTEGFLELARKFIPRSNKE